MYIPAKHVTKKKRQEEPTAASVSSYDRVIWTQSSGFRLDEKQTVDQGRTENIGAAAGSAGGGPSGAQL